MMNVEKYIQVLRSNFKYYFARIIFHDLQVGVWEDWNTPLLIDMVW